MTADDAERGQPRATTLPAQSEDMGRYDGSGKSPDEIENDIIETRAQLGEILDELERKLAPRQLLERGVDMLKDTMAGNGGKIGETLRNHPVPLALIGVGIGWMLMSGTGRGRVGEYGSVLRDRVSGTVSDMADRAGALAGQVKEKVTSAVSSSRYSTEETGYAYGRPKPGEAMGNATRRAADLAATGSGMAKDAMRKAQDVGSTAWQRAGDQFGSARDRFAEVVDQHPLAIGALGLMAGAVIAFILPTTRIEEEWVGPARDQFRDQAASLGREAIERAQHVAERTVDAATGAVKEAVGEATDATATRSEDKKS